MTVELKIKFDIPSNLSPANWGILLRDALDDFCDARTPLFEYLLARYSQDYLNAHPEKAVQVAQRVKIAAALKESLQVTQEREIE